MIKGIVKVCKVCGPQKVWLVRSDEVDLIIESLQKEQEKIMEEQSITYLLLPIEVMTSFFSVCLEENKNDTKRV